MANIVASQVTEITDPKIRQLAVRIVRELELTAEKVACNHADPKRWPLATDGGSTEAILASRFRTLPDSIKQSAATKAMARVTAAPAVRVSRFADLANVNLTITRAIDAQVRDLPFPTDLKLPANFLQTVTAPPPPPPAAPALNRLEFRIHSVKCLDETDGFLGSEAGSDEISLGGTIVDETGDTEKVSVFKVGSFGKDGTIKDFTPPRSFAVFDLTEGPSFPKSYFVTMVLAEVDMGGLSDFVNQLLNKIKEKVISALASAIGAAIGAPAGGVGAIIGAAVGFVVGEVFRIFKSVWEDDIFAPVTTQVTIPTLSHRFAGGATDSAEDVATFSGHGGKYQISFDWRVFA